MMTVTVRVDAPPGTAQGVKEALAMFLEKYGDVRMVTVQEDAPEQIKIGGV